MARKKTPPVVNPTPSPAPGTGVVEAAALESASRVTVADLLAHDRNANLGTERGREVLGASLDAFGAGRSVLVDKHRRIIAGNKTVEAAASRGMRDVIVVPSDGSQLVVVQRTDLDLDTDPRARSLAVADNRVAEIDLRWDPAALAQVAREGGNLLDAWSPEEWAAVLRELPNADAWAAAFEGVPREDSRFREMTFIFTDDEQVALVKQAMAEANDSGDAGEETKLKSGRQLVAICEAYLRRGDA